jgi:hypothetical protein
VSCWRFWWEGGHEGLLQELKLKAKDQRKWCVMKDKKVVGMTV